VVENIKSLLKVHIPFLTKIVIRSTANGAQESGFGRLHKSYYSVINSQETAKATAWIKTNDSVSGGHKVP
jgi:hypothetical protein